MAKINKRKVRSRKPVLLRNSEFLSGNWPPPGGAWRLGPPQNIKKDTCSDSRSSQRFQPAAEGWSGRDENAAIWAPCDHGGSGPHNEHLRTPKDMFSQPWGGSTLMWVDLNVPTSLPQMSVCPPASTHLHLRPFTCFFCLFVWEDSTSSTSLSYPPTPPHPPGTERNGGIKLEGMFVSKTGKKRLLSNTHTQTRTHASVAA